MTISRPLHVSLTMYSHQCGSNLTLLQVVILVGFGWIGLLPLDDTVVHMKACYGEAQGQRG
jgi:hypothetical protein